MYKNEYECNYLYFSSVEKSGIKMALMSTFRFSLLQTQIIAVAAAGVAAEGLSPNDAKAEAENAALLSVALVENAIVILMLVEDHLRFQSKQSSSLRTADGSPSPLSLFYPIHNNSTIGGSTEVMGDRTSSSSNSGGISLDVRIQYFKSRHACMHALCHKHSNFLTSVVPAFLQNSCNCIPSYSS